ncbi:MAG: peptidoglycan editing factor PgeF [Planctomycetota bacterium]
MTDSVAAIELLPQLGSGLVACYARRSGGVSGAEFSSLNLGFSTGDDRDRVVENRRRLALAVGAPLERWIVTGQVHGAEVLVVDRAAAGTGSTGVVKSLPAADAVVLLHPGSFALSLSADCPLVLVADPTTRLAGVAHAGWRGTVAGVVENLVQALLAQGARAADLHAAVSPGIGQCCFEVGPEVLQAAAARPGFAAAARGNYLDLRTLHRHSLEQLGVAPSRIAVSAECSACTPEHYFSHRRDHGRSGRNGALIGWR